jgi:hypothetical protein
MKMKKLSSMVGLCAAVLLAGSACVDLEVANLNDPDRERAIQSPGDVEALVSGAFQLWEGTTQDFYPNMPMLCIADHHSSSWGNFGMRDNCSEPRIAWNNDPSYGSRGAATGPWNNSYGSLAAVRDGLIAINGGLRIQEDPNAPDNTERLVLFGKLVQALTFANLALIFDQAFAVDETVEDVGNLELMDYNQMWAAAEAKFAEVIQGAQSGSFTIPSTWVAFSGDWDGARMAEVARAYRTRYRTQVPRTPAERQALNWSAILADASMGISEPYGGVREEGGNWVIHAQKRYTWFPGWARVDYRAVGPSDASGNYQTWINAPLDNRTPFDIDTDDRRITEGTPKSDGKYVVYEGSSPFPADRGIYHYSNYREARWEYLWVDHRYIAFWPDMTAPELEMIAAEANYWLGNKEATMETVNKYRTMSGELPAFTDVNGVAPGGDRCVPKMADGSCGDLWEAYKYEKRMEIVYLGMATHYLDDRGWGDMVTNSWTQLPVPGSELELLLMEIYTFGGPGGNSSAPDIINDFTAEGLRNKLRGIELWREVNVNVDDDDIPIRR